MTGVEKKKYEELLKACKGDEDRAQWEYLRWKCLTDLYFLGVEILGLGKKKGKVHPPFHRWLCHVMSLSGDKMIIVPRKHAKTTWMKVRIVQILLLNEGKVRIMLLSKTELLSVLNLKSIKRFLALPLLRRLFPEVIPSPGKDYKNWSKSTSNELTMKEDPDAVSNEPQIIALGSAASFTGTAIDYIFMDDYIDNDTVRTATQMQKAEEEWGYIQPILDDGGQIMITGTFYHYNDLYNKIIKEKQFPANRIFQRSVRENGKIIYPTMFTEKRLERLRKTLGHYLFSCQFESNPTPKEDQIFPGPQPVCNSLPKDNYKYYIVMDPAATESVTSDETGAVVAAVNDRSHVYYVEAVGFKKDGPGKADWLIQKCMQYRPVKVGIEYGLQRNLDFTIRTKVSEYEALHKVRVPITIEEIKITNKQRKGDRIHLTLGSAVRNGNVTILEAGCRDLIAQMDTFTGKGKEKDDVVDAAALLFPLVGTFGFPTSLIERIKPEEGTFFEIFKTEEDDSWRGNFVQGRSA